jgi:predicted CoA-substrate-specific enzyme activase
VTAGDVLVAGVDVGSTLTKVVVANGDVLAAVAGRTEADYVRGAVRLLDAAVDRTGRRPADLACVVATGYGRRRLPFATREITEIACHARGVHALHPEARTVIDVGGQDAKAIRLRAGGRVANFAMNDKCAAGTGRFLEVMAATLGMGLDELGRRGWGAADPVEVSSVCTVFAEQEVAQHLAGGAPVPRVLAGLHAALASRIHVLARRVGVEPEVVLTGGCARNPALRAAIEERLGARVRVPAEPLLTGALGAALLAREHAGGGPAQRLDIGAGGMAGLETRGAPADGGPDGLSLVAARLRLKPFEGEFALPAGDMALARPVAGVDAGARFTKAVVLAGPRATLAVVPSEARSGEAGVQALARALGRAGLSRQALAAVGATGLGAAGLAGARPASEITALGRGAARLFPEAAQVIDVGAHGTRAARLGARGAVRDLSVSGQCAAGSARILEVIAHLLGTELEDLGPLSRQAGRPADYAAGCAVFAETEAISLLTRGVSPADLLAGLHQSLGGKIAALARGRGSEGPCVVAGGGAKDEGLLAALGASLPDLRVPPEPMVVAALGAALLAADGAGA